MTTMYATITSKGQLTLPVAARRRLGLRAGQRVALRLVGNSLVLDAPPNVDALREVIRFEAIRAGTWGLAPEAGAGWSHRAEDYRADS